MQDTATPCRATCAPEHVLDGFDGHVLQLGGPIPGTLIQGVAAAQLKGIGDSQSIVLTIASSSAVSSLVNGLAPGGRLVKDSVRISILSKSGLSELLGCWTFPVQSDNHLQASQ
jgi:hypothetical protein